MNGYFRRGISDHMNLYVNEYFLIYEEKFVPLQNNFDDKANVELLGSQDFWCACHLVGHSQRSHPTAFISRKGHSFLFKRGITVNNGVSIVFLWMGSHMEGYGI